MPARKEVVKAYPAFRKQHPRPPPQEHEAPSDGCTTREEPIPLLEGSATHTILLLAQRTPADHPHRWAAQHILDNLQA